MNAYKVRTEEDPYWMFKRTSHYDMPRDTNPPHWTAFRGCSPECPACGAEQDIAERNEQ